MTKSYFVYTSIILMVMGYAFAGPLTFDGGSAGVPLAVAQSGNPNSPSFVGPPAPTRFSNPLKSQTLQDLLVAILNAVIFIMFPIIVLMLVITGFLYVRAQGNESKLSEVHRAFLWTLVGGLVILGSKALALAIQATVSGL